MVSRRQSGIVRAVGNCSPIRSAVDRNRGFSESSASVTDGYDEVRSAFSRRGALGKLEVANTRAPVEVTCRVIVLGRVAFFRDFPAKPLRLFLVKTVEACQAFFTFSDFFGFVVSGCFPHLMLLRRKCAP